MAAIVRLNRIWRSNTITFASNLKFYKSFVISVYHYGCETRTLLVDCETRTLLVDCETRTLLADCETRTLLADCETRTLLVDCETRTLLADCETRIQVFEPSACGGNFSSSPTWSRRPTTRCGARSTSS